MKIEIKDSGIGKRVDAAISELLPELSRTKVQKLIKAQKVTCNDALVVDASKKIVVPCIVEIADYELDYDYKIIPEKIDLNIVYEDEFIIVINKSAGMVCHPAPGHKSGTLVNAIAYYYRNQLSDIGGAMRPGIVHRLDKDTSGLMLIAKTNEAHMSFANLFANEKGNLIQRKYVCFVFGIPSPRNGTVETFITRHPRNRQMFIAHNSIGKKAITLYEVEKSIYCTSKNAISKVNCELLTGRTHQIRVHMKYIGCNIIGDKMYGRLKVAPTYPEIVRNFSRQALHSNVLEFQHPFTQKWLHFEANLPEDMQKLEQLINCLDPILL